jgi:hypothetical protein
MRITDAMSSPERPTAEYRQPVTAAPPTRFSPAAVRSLLGHDWPGNVRELQNRIQRAILLCHGGVVEPGDLGLDDATVAADTIRPRHHPVSEASSPAAPATRTPRPSVAPSSRPSRPTPASSPAPPPSSASAVRPSTAAWTASASASSVSCDSPDRDDLAAAGRSWVTTSTATGPAPS